MHGFVGKFKALGTHRIFAAQNEGLDIGP